MKYLLFIFGAVVAYEVVARITEHYTRHADLHEEARQNRVRVLNQTGQLPGEISY